MIYEVSFRPEADADLSALYDYIAEHSSLVRAGDFMMRIEAACMALAEFPRRGVPRDDLGPGLRTLAFERRAVIVYGIERQTVRILHIFYAARDFERALAGA